MSHGEFVDAAVAVAMLHGHDPREAREYPLRDLHLLMTVHTATAGGLL